VTGIHNFLMLLLTYCTMYTAIRWLQLTPTFI